MRTLTKSRRAKSLIALLLVVLVVGWLFWNRAARTDMAAYAPVDSLAFLEVNDLTEVAQGIGGTQAWKALAGPVGARSSLLPNRWFIRLARWTGIGSTDAILFARS